MSARNRFDQRVRASVGSALYEQILRRAAARRISVSRCIRNDLEEIYAIRDELSRPVEVAADQGETRPRLIHRLLSDTEERLAADLGRHGGELAALREAMRRLEVMIDQQYVGLMLLLPDAPDGDRDARARSALRRYEAWKEAVDQLLRSVKDPA